MKFKVKAKSKFNRRAVKKRSDETSVDALYKAGAYLRTTARRSIRKSPKASQKGKPPHSRRGQLRTAIVFAVDEKKLIALVGPSASLISDIAKYHEFGGVQTKKSKRKKYRVGSVGPVGMQGDMPRFALLKTQKQVEKAKFVDHVLWKEADLSKTRKYPRRPFMGPAMQMSTKQLNSIFRVSLAPATSL